MIYHCVIAAINASCVYFVLFFKHGVECVKRVSRYRYKVEYMAVSRYRYKVEYMTHVQYRNGCKEVIEHHFIMTSITSFQRISKIYHTILRPIYWADP